MTPWWDRTDPSDRPDLTNRTPAGIIESWWNVIPMIVLSGGFTAARWAFAIFCSAIAVVIELVFVRKLVRRIAGRRALSKNRGDGDDVAGTERP